MGYWFAFASSGNYEICWAQINTGGTFGSTSPFGLVSGTMFTFTIMLTILEQQQFFTTLAQAVT